MFNGYTPFWFILSSIFYSVYTLVTGILVSQRYQRLLLLIIIISITIILLLLALYFIIFLNIIISVIDIIINHYAHMFLKCLPLVPL